jgi:hypothetical protein
MMGVRSSVALDFSQCPDCRDDMEVFIEILHATSFDIEGVLRSWRLSFNRTGSYIEVTLSCRGRCSFAWDSGLAAIKAWKC